MSADRGSVRRRLGWATSPQFDFVLHAALFVIVNAIYLVAAWPLWLWVTGLWAVGLAVHAAFVFRPGGERWRAGRGADRPR